MARNLLVYDRERRLLFVSSIFNSINDDYPWLKSFIEENPKAKYDDIRGNHEREDFFNNRYPEILKQAITEWGSHKTNPVEIKEWGDNFRCDLCYHRIINVCTIVNRLNDKELKVGTECVKHFGITFEQDPIKLLEAQRKMKRVNILEKEIPGIENEIRRWNDDVDLVPLLLPDRIVNPFSVLGDKAKNIFESFIERSAVPENDLKDIGVLKEIIIEKKSATQEIQEYISNNKNDIFIPNRQIINWVEDKNKRYPDDPTLQWLKEDGKIKMRTAFRIGEQGYLESLIPKLNAIVKRAGWNIDGIIQYRGVLGYEVYIQEFKLLVFCGYENFIYEFGEEIFNKNASTILEEKKIIGMCQIHTDVAMKTILDKIERLILGRYTRYSHDQKMDEIIFVQYSLGSNDYLYITKKLSTFIDNFKYAILDSEKGNMVKQLNLYYDDLDKGSKQTKKDIDFLLNQRRYA